MQTIFAIIICWTANGAGCEVDPRQPLFHTLEDCNKKLNELLVYDDPTRLLMPRHGSLQRAINSGAAWSMQGSMGRSMMQAIEAGHCMLGLNGCRDYYGNYIPSRDQVQAGTKGSYEFVVEHMGSEWADNMKAVL
jgi:hypothetical protein